MDHYQSIEAPGYGDYREKGSKFFAYLRPCDSEQALKDLIAELRKEHPSARHFCYGAVIRAEHPEERSSDAGEPSGTAGLPILNQLLSAELRNVACVVVRYFGGTKLGKPGLIHAYKESTLLAISSTNIITKTITRAVVIDFAYDQTSAVMPLIERFEGAEISDQDYNERCLVTVKVPKSRLDNALHLFDHIPSVSVSAVD
ncbi:MAG: YigZ family protein [Flavobacteriales bacterium]